MQTYGTNGVKGNLIMGNYRNVHENTHYAKRHGTVLFSNSSKTLEAAATSLRTTSQRNNSSHDIVFHSRRKYRFIIEFFASFTWMKAREKVEQFHEYLSSAKSGYFDSLAQREDDSAC